MARFNPLLYNRPAIWSYGVAVLSVAAVLLMAQWPKLHLQEAPVSLFLCAVILSAWFGGVWPGLLTTVLSVLAFYYYFLPPIYSLAPKPDEIARLLLFTISAFFVGALGAAQRSATESLRRAHDALTLRMQEIQQANEALQAESRERTQVENRLRRSEAYLAEAQKISETGSWAWSPATGDIRYWSEECYRVLGFDPIGPPPRFETFFERIHPDDQAASRARFEKATRERADFEMDYRIVHPGGQIRDIHAIGHPVLSDSGNFVEFVGTVMDVTKRKRAEEERERLRQAQADLARANRVTTMGELTASLAHEVNQPIGAAVTNANTCIRWLAGDNPNIEEARAAALRSAKDGRRAAEIISRIRLLFKKSAVEREPVDVNEVIREMIVLLHGETTRYRILVETDLALDLSSVLGDPVQLQQVMMNLIMNSIDAMKDVEGDRTLAIKSQRADDGKILINVSDTGVGLPLEQKEQIFSAFFTTKSHGTGMGLSISRSIVESHGGRLWATANSPRGASFCLTLPVNIETSE